MGLKLAVPKEIRSGERRIALDPGTAERLAKLSLEVLIQAGAGQGARIPDAAFDSAQIIPDASTLYGQADIVLKVQPPTVAEIAQLKAGAVVIGYMAPHQNPEQIQALRDRPVTSFAMELIPRISRAQSMDALSSQAAVAGYKAAIMGAELANRFFPMLTTAAGTIRPAKALIIGAGVAGLQAIATCRRLGAQVEAYDVRAATKEQVQSLGAKFLDLEVKAEGAGGYARELTEAERQQQQATLARHISLADVVITTAAVPGRTAPRLITRAMVEGMKSGAVIVDLAAESGGNCELSEPGKTVEYQGVIIHAPLNVPSQAAFHASEMYARNLFNFLSPMLKDGAFAPDWTDEVIAQSVLTHQGEIKHAPTRQLIEGEPS